MNLECEEVDCCSYVDTQDVVSHSMSTHVYDCFLMLLFSG